MELSSAHRARDPVAPAHRFNAVVLRRSDQGVRRQGLAAALALASFVERESFTMRMGGAPLHPTDQRFSKKVENPRKTLIKATNGHPTTLVVAGGVTDHVWTQDEVAALLD